MKLLTTAQIIARYGQPGTANLIQLPLPYPMRIAWDLKMTVSTMQVHRLAAPRFEGFFKGLLLAYGLEEIRKLGIDLFGGCYNFRKMRGGDDWSRHSWAIATDLDPVRNPLKASNKTAQFDKPPYKPMIDIAYKNGLLNLGVEKNYDWMHFEVAS